MRSGTEDVFLEEERATPLRVLPFFLNGVPLRKNWSPRALIAVAIRQRAHARGSLAHTSKTEYMFSSTRSDLGD